MEHDDDASERTPLLPPLVLPRSGGGGRRERRIMKAQPPLNAVAKANLIAAAVCSVFLFLVAMTAIAATLILVLVAASGGGSSYSSSLLLLLCPGPSSSSKGRWSGLISWTHRTAFERVAAPFIPVSQLFSSDISATTGRRRKDRQSSRSDGSRRSSGDNDDDKGKDGGNRHHGREPPPADDRPLMSMTMVRPRPGFHSYADYRRAAAAASSSSPFLWNVSYDSRAILLNGKRALFLSGSLHPARHTRSTWTRAVDMAVLNGLNMITLYVMWSSHQPFFSSSNSSLRFDRFGWLRPFQAAAHEEEEDGPSSLDRTRRAVAADDDAIIEWSLAESIRIASERGLFIHLRVGPYVCAEYAYGGIPEWLPVMEPDMDMRRFNPKWKQWMHHYVSQLVQYLDRHKLWSYQGGPIIMVQIENELQQDDNDDNGDIDSENVGTTKTSTLPQSFTGAANSSATLQDYADWCGALVESLIPPGVVATMCNGLVAPNTIETFNGDWQSAEWLRREGNSGRIQVDQPALWTENEGGFQIWGDRPDRPSDYYWGRTARDLAFQTLQWFARGGSHTNYYMFGGGYNYGRSSAAGITTMYASDSVVCSSGQPRQPKYDHLASMHDALADTAHILLTCPTALHQNRSAQYWNGSTWNDGGQKIPVYRYAIGCDENRSGTNCREALFVENHSDEDQPIRIQVLSERNQVVTMKPQSSVLFVDGKLRFDSGRLSSRSQAYRRRIVRDPVPLLNWTYWEEPVGVAGLGSSIETSSSSLRGAVVSTRPMEQTALIVMAGLSTDYAWYEVNFSLPRTITANWAWTMNRSTIKDLTATLMIETQQANGMVAYVDGSRVGAADTHRHKEGNVTLALPIPERIVREMISAAMLTTSMRHPTAPPLYPSSRPLPRHRISILSESFGHGNLIGCFGVKNTRAKTKGITGKVELVFEWQRRLDPRTSTATADIKADDTLAWQRWTVNLVGGRHVWRSLPGLKSFSAGISKVDLATRAARRTPRGLGVCAGGLWSTARFVTPEYNWEKQGLFVEVMSGRGHLWLNGIDLGRYWDLTSNSNRSSSSNQGVGWSEVTPLRGAKAQTQRYYFLPPDLLRKGSTSPSNGNSDRSDANELKFFDTLGAHPPSSSTRPRLVLSWVEPTVIARTMGLLRGDPASGQNRHFTDQVGFPDACLY